MFLGGCPCCGEKGPWGCYTDNTEFSCYKEDDQPDGWTVSSGPYETSEECDEVCGKYFCWINEGGTDFQCVQSKEDGPDDYELYGGPYETEEECEDNCGYWQCYTDGTDSQCVKFDETPPAGWETNGIKHTSKLQCETFCGKFLCVANEDRSDFQCLPPGTPVPDGYQAISAHDTAEDCNDKCDSFSCWKLQPPIPCKSAEDPCDCTDATGSDQLITFSESCTHYFSLDQVRYNGSAAVGGGADRPPNQTDEVFGWMNNLNLVGHNPGGLNNGTLDLGPYAVLKTVGPYGRPNGVPDIYGLPFSEGGIGMTANCVSAGDPPVLQALTFGIFFGSESPWRIRTPWVKDNSWRPGYFRRFFLQGGLNELQNELRDFTQIDYDICKPGNKQVNMAMSRNQIGSVYNTFALFIEWQAPGQNADQRAGFAQYFFDGTYTVEFERVVVDVTVGKCTLSDGSCVDATQKQCVEELCGYWSPGPDCDPYKPSKYCLNYDPSGGGANPDWIPEGDGMTYDECQAICTNTRKVKAMPTTKATTGPGTELANMLAAWGIHAKEKGCGCKKMSRLMDGWGAACATEPHLTTIVDHLQKEAKKRGLPFVRKVGEMLVKRAVRKSQQNS